MHPVGPPEREDSVFPPLPNRGHGLRRVQTEKTSLSGGRLVLVPYHTAPGHRDRPGGLSVHSQSLRIRSAGRNLRHHRLGDARTPENANPPLVSARYGGWSDPHLFLFHVGAIAPLAEQRDGIPTRPPGDRGQFHRPCRNGRRLAEAGASSEGTAPLP